jgi:hypothetical protein
MKKLNTLAAATAVSALSAGYAAYAPAAAAAQDGDESGSGALVEQADAVTRDTSTAEIVQRSNQSGTLGEVTAIELFTGRQLQPDPARGIVQKARGATARITYLGVDNAAAIYQSDDTGDGADGSSATISLGNDSAPATASTAYIDQRGDKGVVDMRLQGDANFAAGIQRANADGSASGAEQTHTLAGHDHRSEIVQEASSTLADVTLSQGGGSTGQVRQTQVGAKASIAIKNGPGSRAVLVQTGTGRGNAADVDIDGNSNDIDIAQHGDDGGHEASVTQAGENSQVALVQQGKAGNVTTIDQNGTDGSAVVRQDNSPRNKAQIDQASAGSVSLKGLIEQSGSGGNNAADIDQTGSTHSAIVRQRGSGGGSVAGIDQSTDDTDENEATVEQVVDAGSGTDTVDIDQGGSANRAIVQQERSAGGTGSNASVTQPGGRGRATIVQKGPALKAQIDQNGNANEGEISQLGTGTAGEASIKAGSGTDNNLARILQDTGGSIGAIDQTSPNNKATIEQANAQPQAGTVEADIDQGGGVQNTAAIAQAGGGTERSASLAQSGRENDGEIDQSGAANGITANVQMAGDLNTLRLIQSVQDNGNIQADLKQQGNENTITWEQRGSELGASVTQQGSGNAVEVSQSGSGYDVSITQNGDNNSLRITYSGPSEGGGGFTVVQNGGEIRHAD